MEVYVITSGSYSDYRIKRVFMDREKAERYVSLAPDCEIETYQADDEQTFEPLRYVDVTCFAPKYGRIQCSIDVVSTNTADKAVDGVESVWWYGVFETLHLSRIVDNDTDSEIIHQRYERICHDLVTEIRSLTETEGWTDEMVDEWLADKGGRDDEIR